MENPVVGGYSAEKVALRRAMVLGNDVGREIRLARHGQAIPAQSLVVPLVEGYRADLRTPMSVYDPARAKALLDVYGYVDRDGDGWRETPEGQPLVLVMATQSDQTSRQLDELWKKNMDAIGLKVEMRTAQWPENLKSARAGKFMLWRVGSLASIPDGQNQLERAYGPSAGNSNLARFHSAQLDALYEQLKQLPSGQQRQTLFDEAAEIVAAYVPYRTGTHRIITDLAYPQVVGFRHPPFALDWWQYVDVADRRVGVARRHRHVIRRRDLVAAPLLLGGLERARAVRAGTAVPAQKVLRYAFTAAETGFDPVRLNDLYSRVATSHMFEAPYRYDYLARPVKVVPHTAVAMPEISDDFKTVVVRIRPGIFFTPDDAFRGRPRELVAADYVYSWKRFFDPATTSPRYSQYAGAGALGCDTLRAEALEERQVRLRPRDRGRARARPLHGAMEARRGAAAFHLPDRRQRRLWRGGPRGVRCLG